MFLKIRAKSIFLCLVFILLGSFPTSLFSQKQYSGDPVTKNGLLKALKLRQFQTSDFVEIVNKNGVEFRLTNDVQSELQKAGARPELIEAIRRNYRGALKIKPSNATTYEGLISKAVTIYESNNNAYEAISILNKAVEIKPNEYKAYQMLGYVTLYGKGNFREAEDHMKKAISLGGSAVFRLKHAHDYNFLNSCQGSLYISNNTIRFEGDDNSDTFQVNKSQIEKINTVGKWSGLLKLKGGVFHIEIRDKNFIDKDKYQFSPLTGKTEESKMIIRLIGK